MISDQSLRVVLRSDRAVRLWGDVIRAAIAAGLTILIATAVLYHAAVVRFMFGRLHMNDFGKFYYSAQYFLDGYDMYMLSPATMLLYGDGEPHQLLNMNPPHFHLLVLPLARLSPAYAMAIWSLIGVAGLTWSAWLITRELHVRWTPARVLWGLLAFLVCSPTGAVIITGQLTFQLLPVITLAWLAARHNQWVRAGLLLGIAAGIKPHLGFFGLFLLVGGQWRAGIAMASTVCVSFAVGLLVFGSDAHLHWIAALRAVDWSFVPMNGSMTGLFVRIFDAGTSPPLIPVPALSLMIAVVCIVVAGVSLMPIARRDGRVSVDQFFALALLAAQLLSPLGWIYYLWLAAGPLLGMWLSARPQPFRARDVALWLALPGLLWPIPLFTLGAHLWWQPLTLRSIYSWMTLWLWVAVVLEIGRTTFRSSPALDSRSGS